LIKYLFENNYIIPDPVKIAKEKVYKAIGLFLSNSRYMQEDRARDIDAAFDELAKAFKD